MNHSTHSYISNIIVSLKCQSSRPSTQALGEWERVSLAWGFGWATRRWLTFRAISQWETVNTSHFMQQQLSYMWPQFWLFLWRWRGVRLMAIPDGFPTILIWCWVQVHLFLGHVWQMLTIQCSWLDMLWGHSRRQNAHCSHQKAVTNRRSRRHDTTLHKCLSGQSCHESPCHGVVVRGTLHHTILGVH